MECNSTSNSLDFTLRSLLISQNDMLRPPLLEHTSPLEAHFYPLSHARPLLLHTHTNAPIRILLVTLALGTGLRCLAGQWVLYSSMDGIQRTGEIRAWRYDLPSFVLRCSTDTYNEALMPCVSKLLSISTHRTLPRILVSTFALGNGGEVFFALHAPCFLLFATGLVVLSWWVLPVTMWLIHKSKGVLARTKSETWMTCTTLLSMFILLIPVSTLVFLASRIPLQLVNPPRELRDSPPLPCPTRRRVHSSAVTFSQPGLA